jgi:hypothetical protein
MTQSNTSGLQRTPGYWCALLVIFIVTSPAWGQGDVYQSGSGNNNTETYQDQFSTSCEQSNSNNPFAGMDPLSCHGVMAPVDSQGNCSLPRMTLLKQEGRECYYCQALDPPIKGIVIPFDQLREAGRQGFKCGVDQADPKCKAICVNEGISPGYTPPPGTSADPEPSPAPALPEPPLPGGPPDPDPPASPPPPLQTGTSQTCFPALQERQLYNEWVTWCEQWRDMFFQQVFSPLDGRWTSTMNSICYRVTFTINNAGQFGWSSAGINEYTPSPGSQGITGRAATQFVNEVKNNVQTLQGKAPPFPAGSTLKTAKQVDDILINCQPPTPRQVNY